MLKKHQRDYEKHLKIFEDGDFVLWLLKDLEIKGKLFFP
jgi:hypothetical protein